MKSLVLGFTLFVAAGCALFRGTTRAASYGVELASCEAEAPRGPAGWAIYTPCCVQVNRRYPLPDGGARDASLCYAPDGGS